MGLGVLEDGVMDHVPGTANVYEAEHITADGGGRQPRDERLKYDKTGKILLVPQPSDDPNDPLNWPLWKRDTITFLLCLISVLASTLSPLLAADTASLAIYFRRTFTDMALLTGYHLLGVGLAGFLLVPSARIWGKRHLYLFGALIVIVSSAWGGASKKNYQSLLWARIFQGVGLAPFEALVNASVGDLYCVHERGVRMAASNMALFGGAFFTPVLVGKIAHTMGYKWTFWFVAIFTGVLFPFLVLWCPETTYKRETRFDIDTMGNLITEQELGRSEEMGKLTEGHGGHVRSEARVPVKHTWRQSMALFNGRKTDEHYVNLLLRPFPLFFHPGILWACLIQGALIGWTVLIGVVLAGIMLGPPLWFNEVQTGYMYTGAFLGALIGFAICGLISDVSARTLTKWNNGVYEPEFRMVLVVPQLILGCAGLYGFGWTANNSTKYGWVWPCFFFGMEVAGMVIGAVVSALYVVDGFRNISVEGFTCLLVFKNIFSFALTFKGYEWIVEIGIKEIFVIIASVQVGVCALTIPLYIFGKINRSYLHRHNIFFKVPDLIGNWVHGVHKKGEKIEG